MTTYRAWDGNDYPWPPPQGWYRAGDDRWWPEGYGPGPAPTVPPAVTSPTDPTTVMATTLPAHEPPSAWTPPPASVAADPFAAPRDASPVAVESSTVGGKGLMIGLALLALLIVGAAGLFFATRGGDDVAVGPGSADEPHRFGQLVRLSYDDPTTGEQVQWTIEVLAPLADETDAVLAADPALAPPGESLIVASTTLRAVHVAGPATTVDALRFDIVVPSGARTSEYGCAAGPDGWGVGTAMSPDATVEGRLCWAVGIDQVAGSLLVVSVPGVDGEVYVGLQ